MIYAFYLLFPINDFTSAGRTKVTCHPLPYLREHRTNYKLPICNSISYLHKRVLDWSRVYVRLSSRPAACSLPTRWLLLPRRSTYFLSVWGVLASRSHDRFKVSAESHAKNNYANVIKPDSVTKHVWRKDIPLALGL